MTITLKRRAMGGGPGPKPGQSSLPPMEKKYLVWFSRIASSVEEKKGGSLPRLQITLTVHLQPIHADSGLFVSTAGMHGVLSRLVRT